MGDTYKTPGERLRAYRTEAGISQKDFARAIGIQASSLSEIETGESKRPSAPTLLKAAEHLKVNPLNLLTGDGPKLLAVEHLRERELRLLLLFRDLSERQQDAVYEAAQQIAQKGREARPRQRPDVRQQYQSRIGKKQPERKAK